MCDMLSVEGILPVLNAGNNPLKAISVFENIDSTNEWCLQQCRENKALPFACIADVQNKGKGRRGRHWVSAKGTSVTMSFATAFELESDQLGMLSMAIGMAVVDVLRSLSIKNAMLKWPNDVIVDHQKIAGILIETVHANNRLNVVVGVGVNYDMSSCKTDSIKTSWTDILQCLGHELEGGRNRLAGNLLKECLNMCEQYPRNFDSLSVEFDSRYNAYINEPVKVVTDNGACVEGVCVGTTKQGELRVLVEEKEQVFNSAEISLRMAIEC